MKMKNQDFHLNIQTLITQKCPIFSKINLKMKVPDTNHFQIKDLLIHQVMLVSSHLPDMNKILMNPWVMLNKDYIHLLPMANFGRSIMGQ